MVSAYTGTKMYEDNKSNLFFNGYYSDTAVTNLAGDMKVLVENYPEIFAGFQYIGTKNLDRRFLLKVNFLFLTLMHYFPYTSLDISQTPSSNYPRRLLESLSSLDCLNSTWILSSDEMRINTVYQLLKGFLEPDDADMTLLREVLEYEKTASDLEYGLVNDESMMIREFEHDVEGWIVKVVNGETPPLSDFLQIHVNQILFLKKDGKVKTMILPDQLTKHI